jgi:hypothetical protein
MQSNETVNQAEISPKKSQAPAATLSPEDAGDEGEGSISPAKQNGSLEGHISHGGEADHGGTAELPFRTTRTPSPMASPEDPFTAVSAGSPFISAPTIISTPIIHDQINPALLEARRARMRAEAASAAAATSRDESRPRSPTVTRYGPKGESLESCALTQCKTLFVADSTEG